MTTTPGTLRAKLTLDVTYALNGVSAEAILDLLQRSFERAISDGALSGHTEAEVDEHSMSVVAIDADLDEEQLAKMLSLRIENGHIGLEDIPLRMARYGLMNPASFINEMAERHGTEGIHESEEPLKMRIFEFGTAPQAAAEGYKLKTTLYATVDELKACYGSQDLIFVYGASVHGQPGVFEFARFEPITDSDATAKPDPSKILYDGGSAYGLIGGHLVSAPMFVDGRIDDSNWGPVDFLQIGDGEAAYCRVIQQALEAMANRDH